MSRVFQMLQYSKSVYSLTDFLARLNVGTEPRITHTHSVSKFINRMRRLKVVEYT